MNIAKHFIYWEAALVQDTRGDVQCDCILGLWSCR